MLKIKLKEAEEEINSQADKIRGFEEMNYLLKSERNDFHSDFSSIEKKYKEDLLTFKTKIQEKDETNMNLSSENEKLKLEIERLKREILNIQNEVISENDLIDRIGEIKDRFNERENTLREEKDAEILELQKTIKNLNTKIYTETKLNQNNSQFALVKLTNENENLKEDLVSITAEIDILKDYKEKAIKYEKKLMETENKLAKEKETLEAELEAQQHKITNYQTNVELLEKELISAKEKLGIYYKCDFNRHTIK